MGLVYLNHFIKRCEERAIVRPGDVTKPIADRCQIGVLRALSRTSALRLADAIDILLAPHAY